MLYERSAVLANDDMLLFADGHKTGKRRKCSSKKIPLMVMLMVMRIMIFISIFNDFENIKKLLKKILWLPVVGNPIYWLNTIPTN